MTTTFDKLNSFAITDNIRKCLQQKYDAVYADSYWPTTPSTKASATITAQGTDARGWFIEFTPALTINDFNPSLINPGGPGGMGNPAVFQAIINDADPTKCVRLGVMSIDSFPVGATGTSNKLYLTTPKAYHPDYLNYAAVVGKKIYIATGYSVSEDPWWNERWFQHPNDTIKTRKVTGTSTAGVLADTTLGSVGADYVGKHLWYAGNRYVIASATATTLTFTNANVSPLPAPSDGEVYYIIHADGYFNPENITADGKWIADNVGAWKWHNVPTEGYYAHDPQTGAVGSTAVSRQFVKIKYPQFDGSCPTNGETKYITDEDQWTGQPNWCESPDTCKTPWFFRSMRGVQAGLESVCGNFVKNIEWNGKEVVPVLNKATWFYAAGINAQSVASTINYNSTEQKYFATIGSFTLPSEVEEGFHWALIDDATGYCYGSGFDTSAAGVDVLPIMCDIPAWHTTADDDYEGPKRNQYSDPRHTGTPHSTHWEISWGWTRKHPKEFKYAYERTAWVPELYTTVEDGSTVEHLADTPTVEHPGIWDVRPVSTHYNYADLSGMMVESLSSLDAITNGDKARYMGDNQNDPGLTETVYVVGYTPYRRTVQTSNTGTEIAKRMELADKFFEGLDSNRPKVGASGIVSSGSAYQIRDTGKTWIEGELIVHTGTSTGGDTTSLEATTDAFWEQVRWNDPSHNRFHLMTVEILIGAVWHKRIVAHSAGYPGTLSWSEPLPDTASGKEFKIVEPKGRLNRWKGKTITLTSPDKATTYTADIIGNDVDTIFFAEQPEAITAGWTYVINEMLPGSTYERVAGKWVLPSEANGSAERATKVHPDLVTRYGKVRKRDVFTPEIFSQIQAGMNALKKTKHGSVSWSANGENNHRFTISPDYGGTWGIYPTFAEMVDYTTAATAEAWNYSPPPSPIDDVAPSGGNSSGCVTYGSDSWYGEVGRASKLYAYATKNLAFTPKLSGTIDFYGIADADAEPGTYITYYEGVPYVYDVQEFAPGLVPCPNGGSWVIHKLAKFESKAVAKNNISAAVGDKTLTKPAVASISAPDPTTNTTPPDANYRNQSCKIVGSETIITWNMTDL